jgi:hypothetical protein
MDKVEEWLEGHYVSDFKFPDVAGKAVERALEKI